MDYKVVEAVAKKAFAKKCEYCGTFYDGNGFVYMNDTNVKIGTILDYVIDELGGYFGEENIRWEDDHNREANLASIVSKSRGYLCIRVFDYRVEIVFGDVGSRDIEYKTFFICVS